MRCNETGKVRHTKRAALALAKKFNNAQLNVYYCHHCRGWHLGNDSKSDFRAQARIDQLLNKGKNRRTP